MTDLHVLLSDAKSLCLRLKLMKENIDLAELDRIEKTLEKLVGDFVKAIKEGMDENKP